VTFVEPIRLEPGDEVRCPHCRRWPPVIAPHKSGTPYTLDMLFWECSKGLYFAGSRGTVSRHPTRRPAEPERTY
jgi:hypothetical protein